LKIQDSRSLELVGVALVVWRRPDIQHDRVSDLRLVVVRVALGEAFHRIDIGLNAPGMRNLIVIGIEGEERIDIVALALAFGADAFALLKGGQPEHQVILGRGEMRIQQKAERNAPIRDGAVGIGLQRLLEYLFRRPVPERMLVAHAPVEAPLRQLIAGRREMDLAELLLRLVLGQSRLGRRQTYAQREDSTKRSVRHGFLPVHSALGRSHTVDPDGMPCQVY
jgi:hypothetical protein